jgi:indole-3-glycerol phosphate synthase
MTPMLRQIMGSVHKRLENSQRELPLLELKKLILSSPGRNGFAEMFRDEGYHIIAEVKFDSPSEGEIYRPREPVPIAEQYLQHGARAISVLTELDHFMGDPLFLKAIRSRFPEARLLMKDFLVSEYQVAMARYLGADAALLIVALLEQEKLKEMISHCQTYEICPLVEVHDAEEFQKALNVGAKLIGVNNRNLRTMKVDLDVCRGLASFKNEDTILIAESGLTSGENIRELFELGYRGFLMGTTFMKSENPGDSLRELMGDLSAN